MMIKMNNYKTLRPCLTLLVFHLDISGSEDNEEQLANIVLRFVTLFVFHLEISGNDNIYEQFVNKPPRFITLFIFHFDISGSDFNDKQL